MAGLGTRKPTRDGDRHSLLQQYACHPCDTLPRGSIPGCERDAPQGQENLSEGLLRERGENTFLQPALLAVPFLRFSFGRASSSNQRADGLRVLYKSFLGTTGPLWEASGDAPFSPTWKDGGGEIPCCIDQSWGAVPKSKSTQSALKKQELLG